MDLYFPTGSRDPQIVRGAVAILATGFLLYKAYVVALAWVWLVIALYCGVGGFSKVVMYKGAKEDTVVMATVSIVCLTSRTTARSRS